MDGAGDLERICGRVADLACHTVNLQHGEPFWPGLRLQDLALGVIFRPRVDLCDDAFTEIAKAARDRLQAAFCRGAVARKRDLAIEPRRIVLVVRLLRRRALELRAWRE